MSLGRRTRETRLVKPCAGAHGAPARRLGLPRVRKGSIIQLVAIGIVAGAICTAVALAIPWMPVAAGREASRIDFVYWFATVIAIAVFSVVASVLIYEVWKFGVRSDDFTDATTEKTAIAMTVANQ